MLSTNNQIQLERTFSRGEKPTSAPSWGLVLGLCPANKTTGVGIGSREKGLGKERMGWCFGQKTGAQTSVNNIN